MHTFPNANSLASRATSDQRSLFADAESPTNAGSVWHYHLVNDLYNTGFTYTYHLYIIS